MFITGLGTATSQTTVQRFCALRTEREAKMWVVFLFVLRCSDFFSWTCFLQNASQKRWICKPWLRFGTESHHFNFQPESACRSKSDGVRKSLFGKNSPSTFTGLVVCYSRSIILLAPAFTIMFILTCLTGLVVFAFYHEKGCDPYRAGQIGNSNQVRSASFFNLIPLIHGNWQTWANQSWDVSCWKGRFGH